jgi:Na+/phosphate symporter
VTDNTSRLWSTPSDRARLNTEFAGASFVQEGGLSTAAQVAIVLGSVVVVGAIVGGVLASGENDNPESFKSTHSTSEGFGLGALLAIPVFVLLLLCSEVDDDCF